MQIEVDVICMQTNIGRWGLSGFGAMAPFCLPSKTAKFFLQTMDYSPCGQKIEAAQNVTKGVFMPSDLDFNLHMNNSKYLRELDFGRFGLYIDKGLWEILIRRGAVFLVDAISIRYRCSLQLFQKFEVHTKILAWDEKVLYLEQRLITTSDNFVAAIALVKMAIKGITTPELIRIMCGQVIASPAPSSELKMWQESINLSSKHLREENSAATVEGFNTKHHSDEITNRPLTKRQ